MVSFHGDRLAPFGNPVAVQQPVGSVQLAMMSLVAAFLRTLLRLVAGREVTPQVQAAGACFVLVAALEGVSLVDVFTVFGVVSLFLVLC